MIPKIAFVTGATRGIGRAIAFRLAKEGYHLAVNGRHEETLTQLVKELKEEFQISCKGYAGDIGDPTFVKETFQQIRKDLGIPQVLINNAGISYIGLLSEMEPEEWETIMSTNLRSVFLCSKYVIGGMLEKGQGRIINISSVWGETGASCEVAYSASKGAVNSFTKALAKELAPSNIQVNAIACGVIDTDMNRCFSKEEREALEEEIPAGRYGEPKEVADMVVSLLQAPEYLTGQIITMDGGWT